MLGPGIKQISQVREMGGRLPLSVCMEEAAGSGDADRGGLNVNLPRSPGSRNSVGCGIVLTGGLALCGQERTVLLIES